jgi:molybdopterin-guanine dinucleotide biosynthesis protein A
MSSEPKFVGSIVFPTGEVERYYSQDALLAAYRVSIEKSTEEFLAANESAGPRRLTSATIFDTQLFSDPEFVQKFEEINTARGARITEDYIARHQEAENVETEHENIAAENVEPEHKNIATENVEPERESTVSENIEQKVVETAELPVVPEQTETDVAVAAVAETGAAAIDVPLLQNEYVQELFSILKDNDKDVSGLAAILSQVQNMEGFIKDAESKITDMKSQLSEMQELHNHPIKTALQNAIRVLETKVAEVKEKIGELKADIVEGCKNAVAAFKEKGETALNGVMSFFHLKSGLQSVKKSLNEGIRECDSAVVKIDNFSREYHAASRHMKNMGRVIIGKKTVETEKPVGKLARAVSAPFRAEKTCLTGARTAVIGAINRIEKLEQSAAVRAEERPSVREKMKVLKAQIAQNKKETPAPVPGKKHEAAL